MKSLLTFTFCLLATLTGKAQIQQYHFSKESGAYTPLMDYSPTEVIDHEVVDDALISPKRKIPFTFRYNGVIADSIGISENGFIWFGPATAEEVVGSDGLSTDYGDRVTGIVSAWGEDLHPHIGPGTSKSYVRSGLVGNAPARMLIIEWFETGRYANLDEGKPEDSLTFAIILYEGMNRVEMKYGFCRINPDISSEVRVGLRSSLQDFQVRKTSDNWNNTSNGDLESTCSVNGTTQPEFGLIFAWMSFNNPNSVTNVPEENLVLMGNPVSSMLKWELSNGNKQEQFRIIDLQGRIIAYELNEEKVFSLNGLPPGTYLLEVTAEGDTHRARFIKN